MYIYVCVWLDALACELFNSLTKQLWWRGFNFVNWYVDPSKWLEESWFYAADKGHLRSES